MNKIHLTLWSPVRQACVAEGVAAGRVGVMLQAGVGLSTGGDSGSLAARVMLKHAF